MPRSRSALVCTLLAGTALAQSNTVQGTDVYLYDVGQSTIYGRRGPAFPNGELGVGFGHAFCNSGLVHIPWQTSPTTNGQMTDVHFKIAFLLARESNGRMVQISKRETGVKHSRVTYNLGSSNCGTCQSGPSSTFRLGCYDAYTTSYNGDRFNIAPSGEIDPWLGSWEPVGSYFDRGDPAVSGAAASDGRQSLTYSQANSFDPVKNRVTVDEVELLQAGTFWAQVHLVCEGEPASNRGDNLRAEELVFNHNGSGNWSTGNVGGGGGGSVLEQWTGATVELGGNGSDDGRFAVALVVTGPTNGIYHYEYAVHNIDNNRGGASFRIPVATTVNVSNVGFRDIDGDPLNEWTFSQTATELSWTAAANNPLDWNTIYNFHFDCDVAPDDGGVLIDQARVGPGNLTVAVTAEVPGGYEPALVSSLGTACGSCDTAFYEHFTQPSGMDLAGASATLAYSGGAYTVGAGTGSWQPPAGTNLGLGDDAEAVVNLPFTLPYPGGSTNQLRVCSNGFVSPAAGNGTSWVPHVSVFHLANARWAPAWHDFAPQNAQGGGGVIFDAGPTGAALTWLDVPNSGFGAPGTSTFQIRFEPSGTVHMAWQTMSTTGNPYLVGWSPGQSAPDGGSLDLTAALPAGFALCGTSPALLALTASARPILGTTMQQTTLNIAPTTPFGLTVMSITQATPPQDLTQFGMEGCFAHHVGGVNQFWFPAGASSVSVPFSVPNDNGLVGLVVVSQSYAYAPPLTTLGLVASNALLLQVGPQ